MDHGSSPGSSRCKNHKNQGNHIEKRIFFQPELEATGSARASHHHAGVVVLCGLTVVVMGLAIIADMNAETIAVRTAK
jgi:hypothetical protein